MEMNKNLLDLLVCPETKAKLILHDNFLISTDQQSRRKYRIEDNIPILLIDESEILDEAVWQSIMDKHETA
jgi:uncharacterized protein